MIEVAQVSRSFGTRTVVADVTLRVAAGAILTIVGTSGSGKTTLLRMINRLVEPSAGTVRVAGRDVRSVPPHVLRRGIGYAIQGHGLFPHRTVAENIGTVPRLLGWDRRRIAARVDELLGLFNLDPALYRHRLPGALSGGEPQRIGVARALAAEPPILLMDEPFGALDAFTREQMQELLLQVWQRTAKPVFLITHDIEEAVFLATDLILLAPNPGQIVERLHLDFGQRYAAGESARAIKSDPRFIETREHVLSKVFSQRSAGQRQERA